MRLSIYLVNELKRHEGFRSQPYLCPTGHVTIGYGHNLEARPNSITRFPEAGCELADEVMEAEWVADAVKAGTLRGRALLDRLKALGLEWSEAEAAECLQQDILALESALTVRCAAYRHLVNGSAARGAGRTLSLPASDPAGVRADVLLNMAFNLGVDGLLKFQRMLEAVRNDDYTLAASEMLNSRWASQVKRRAAELAGLMRTGIRPDKGGL